MLDRRGVAELWLLAVTPLGRACARTKKIRDLIADLPMDPDDYVAEFLTAKVLESPGEDELEHSGALGTYFYRFLISIKRKERIGSQGGSGGDSEAPADSALPEKSLSQALGHQNCHELDPATLLADSFADPERVAESALGFLRTAPQWARLYLRFHDCADKADPDRLTRQILAQRFGIAAYQDKAHKLGVVLPGRSTQAKGIPAAFGESLIGRWIKDEVGIDLDDEHAPLILACFKILCQVALTRVDERGELP
jgi:hypothetical protein